MEFYFILNACGASTGNLASRLMIASLIMLGAGWLAETDILDKVSGFVIGMAGWLYIVNEVHNGEAGKMADKVHVTLVVYPCLGKFALLRGYLLYD